MSSHSGKEKKIAVLLSMGWTPEQIRQKLEVALDDIDEVAKWRQKEWLESWRENEWLKLRIQLDFSKVGYERPIDPSERFFQVERTFAFLRSRVV